MQARTHAAVARVRAGEVEGGLADLRKVVDEAPVAAWRLPPLFFLADLTAEQGRSAEAAPLLRRFQALYLPRTMWRGWAYPRSQLALARAEEALGHRAAARAALAALLAAAPDPEPGDAVVSEARRLAAEMGR